MKILVCGGRDLGDRKLVYDGLDTVCLEYGKPDFLVQGYAPGADKLALNWAILRGIPHSGKKYKAEWKTYGLAAGAIRNKRMLDEEHPDLTVAFPGGPGTRNMVTQSIQAGVPVAFIRIKHGDRILDFPTFIGNKREGCGL